MKDLIVQKYGGSSVGDIEKIKCCQKNNKNKNQEKCSCCCICHGNTTDELIKMAYSISDRPIERELDALLSTGEQISISLLAIAIENMGHEVIS